MDERARAAERDLAHGEPGARAALLAQRFRAGTIDEARLRLAAWLGDEGARATLGEPVASQPDDIDDWARALDGHGQEVLVRAAIAGCEAFIDDWSRARPHDDRPAVALAAARAWLGEPTRERTLAARSAADPANMASAQVPGRVFPRSCDDVTDDAPAPFDRPRRDLRPTFPRAVLGGALAAAAAWAAGWPRFAPGLFAAMLGAAGEELAHEARALIRARLIEWATSLDGRRRS